MEIDNEREAELHINRKKEKKKGGNKGTEQEKNRRGYRSKRKAERVVWRSGGVERKGSIRCEDRCCCQLWNTCKHFIDRRNQLLTARREGSFSLSHQEAQTNLCGKVLLVFIFFIVKHLMFPSVGGMMCQLCVRIKTEQQETGGESSTLQSGEGHWLESQNGKNLGGSKWRKKSEFSKNWCPYWFSICLYLTLIQNFKRSRKEV